MWANCRLRRVQERTAGRRQPDAVHFAAAAAPQALVDGIVLAVDGQQRLALLVRLGDDQVASRDQALFVGDPDGLAGLDGFVGGFQSGDADDGADHEIGVGMGRDLHRARRAVRRLRSACPRPTFFSLSCRWSADSCRRHGDDLGMPSPRLLEGQIDVASGGQADHREAVGEGLDDLQRALADGSGGPEDGDAFHGGLDYGIALGAISSRAVESGG